MGLQEKISKEAYEIYEKNGRQQGNDLLNWLAAERIIQFEQMIIADTGGAFIALLEYKPLKDRAPVAPVAGKSKHRPSAAAKSNASAGSRKGSKEATAHQHAHR